MRVRGPLTGIGREVVALLLSRKRLLARFVLGSLGRSLAMLGVILLLRDFLAAALGQAQGSTHALAQRLGMQGTVTLAGALLIAAYLVGTLLYYDSQITRQRIVRVIELRVMERIVRHLLSLSVSFVERQSAGDLLQTVRQDVAELSRLISNLTAIFIELSVAVAYVTAAVALSPRLAVWGMIVLPLGVFPIFLIARRTYARSFEVRLKGYVLFDVVLEFLHGIRVIRVFRLDDQVTRTTVEKARRYFHEALGVVRVRELSRVVLESLGGLGVVFVVMVGGLEVMRATLEWPALLAFIMALRALNGPLNNINSAYMEVQTCAASAKRIADLLAETPAVHSAADAIPLPCRPTRIAFDDVSFSYGEGRILDGISFEVEAGETLGIVGVSGAGKSTLLNLVARFYDPTSGRVLIDGHDLRDVRIGDYYDNVSIVTQEPFLFAATVRDNIRCGRPAATEAEVEAAARAACIHDEIVALPNGYDTTIGGAERPLSRGQQQRINIARAFLKDAPILLLDEATASVDSVAEAEVQQAADRLTEGRTTFIVAHRISTLRGATRVLVLHEGRAAGLGTHAQLLATCLLYRRLWETQRLDAEDVGRAIS